MGYRPGVARARTGLAWKHQVPAARYSSFTHFFRTPAGVSLHVPASPIRRPEPSFLASLGLLALAGEQPQRLSPIAS
jgi:hypothetical protein